MKNCSYIFVINCSKFFYQWKIHFLDRHKLTIINHQKQKSFNVIIIKYKNSSSYIQRQKNCFLKFCRIFVKAYINNVVIFFKTKKKHFRHLKKMFYTFKKLNIWIKFIKTFSIYFSVRLLNQKINSLNLATNENKFRAINNLKNFSSHFVN